MENNISRRVYYLIKILLKGCSKMVEEKVINKKYLRMIDKELKMIPLTFDVVFKGVFSRNPNILKRFLISILDLKLDIKNTKIEILNNELLKENVKEYQKRVDILVVLNDTIFIDIELNRSNFEKVKLRNSMDCDKLYSMLLEMGDVTTKLKDICLYQLNLNTEDKSITYGEDIIVSYSLVTQDIFIKNKYTILKYLEFYRNLYYTKFDNLSEDEIWLAPLTSRNFTELNKMLSHILTDKDKNKFMKETIRMSKLNFNLHEWEKEKMDELVRLESKRVDREEGKEENTLDIIKNMLKNNISLELIAKVTGKSIEEIEDIRKKLEI